MDVPQRIRPDKRIMKIVATYFDAHGLQLAEAALAKLGIASVRRPDESDGMATALWVPPEHYDRACDVVETVEQFLFDQDLAARNQKVCPNCGSRDMVFRDDFMVASSLGAACTYECRKCGFLKRE